MHHPVRAIPGCTHRIGSRSLRVAAAATLLAGSACISACALPADDTSPGASEEFSTSSSPSISGAGCTGQRWVAEFKSGSCPAGAPPGWSLKPVFTEGGAAPPAGLAAFCEAVWTGPAPWTSNDTTVLKNFFVAQDAWRYEQDCVLTGPLGTPFENESREVLRTALLRQVRALPELPSPIGAMPRRTRLAFLDSSPDDAYGKIPDGRMMHGYSLAWLARNLTCPTFGQPGATCAADIRMQLVLPHVKNDVTDELNGGYFGTREQLAKAIYVAVERWKKDLLANPLSANPRLVINLSVGWEPTDNCATATDPNTMELGSLVVHHALRHASCHGALVVAAAGNTAGALPKVGAIKGPVCPAAWTTHPAPSAAACNAVEGMSYEKPLTALLPIAQFWKLPLALPQPLLYAAGGVDYAQRPIMSTRPLGRPKLAAVSVLAASGDPARPLPEMMTGSSVSAAITSGIATTVWAYRPRLTAPELMQKVYEAGQVLPLKDKADFDLTQAPLIRDLGLCPALMRACEPTQGVAPEYCPSTPVTCAPAEPLIESGTPGLSNALETLLKTEFALAPQEPVLAGGLTLFDAPQNAYQSASVAPWVVPQPISPPCGACVLKVNLAAAANPADRTATPTLAVRITDNYPSTLFLSQTTVTIVGWTGEYNTNLSKKLYTAVVGPIGSGSVGKGAQFTSNLGSTRFLAIYGAVISWVGKETATTIVKSSVTDQAQVTP